jgi:hypothetical protein
MTRDQCCCEFCYIAMRDGEMDKNYAKMGWAWPVDKSSGVLPRYVWKWCPFCGADLPPILDDAAVKRIMEALWPDGKPRFPDWLLKPKKDYHLPDWNHQADGEGPE